MKAFFRSLPLLIISIFISSQLFAQVANRTVLRHLTDHNNTPGAGCFIRDDQGVYAQLNEEVVYLNITGKEEIFKKITAIKKMPKGYTEGFTNGKTNVFIKGKEISKEGCLSEMKYRILIIKGGKQSKSMVDGFCGC